MTLIVPGSDLTPAQVQDLTDGLVTALHKHDKQLLFSAQLATLPNGAIELAGGFELIASAQTISSASNPTIADMLKHQVLLNITAVGTAGTVRITGTSYNPADGTETPADTEDITVGAGNTGFYHSSKRWTGTVTLSGLTTTSVTADTFKFNPNVVEGKFDLRELAWRWEPSAGSNDITVQFFHFKFVPRTRTLIVDETVVNAPSGIPSLDALSFIAGAQTIDFDDDEAVVILIEDNSSISTFGFAARLIGSR